ncbi:hypothetical protein TNCV_1852241 [Trichonephila clavipes]|nr:hypothetical protein TNCV_1852241 [Trichonephila clavipes]
MLPVGVSSFARLRGNLSTDYAIRLPLSNVAEIPHEAIANATLRSLRTLPVPPWASRRKKVDFTKLNSF